MLGVVASNTAMGSDESADGLITLNAMLDSWRNEKLMVYAHQEETLTLSASTTSYTIGPGGTLNTTRPVAIDAAWVVVSSISYGVDLIDDAQYAAIPDKTATSNWPTQANYKPSMSTGTLYVYPVPNTTVTMKLLTRIVVASYSALTDTVTLPPGWEEAIATNLAIHLVTEYPGVRVSDELRMMARDSKASIKRVNFVPIRAGMELGALFGVSSSNILTGP